MKRETKFVDSTAKLNLNYLEFAMNLKSFKIWQILLSNRQIFTVVNMREFSRISWKRIMQVRKIEQKLRNSKFVFLITLSRVTHSQLRMLDYWAKSNSSRNKFNSKDTHTHTHKKHMIEGHIHKAKGCALLWSFSIDKCLKNSSGSSFQGDIELLRGNKKEEELLW